MLEATLSLFLDQSQAWTEVPTLRTAGADPADLAPRRSGWPACCGSKFAGLRLPPPQAFANGQRLAAHPANSYPASSRCAQAIPAGELALRLRRHTPAVFARIHQERSLIDPRTLLEGEEAALVEAFVPR